MKQYLIAFLLLLCTASLKANDLQIANITTNVSGSTTTVSFDISWKNSWRGGVANNYDAAWIFIKYKNEAGEWHHLNLTAANNSAGAPLTIEAPSDKKGVFVYRAANGIGDIAPVNVTLGVQQQPGNYDIKVFGVEMVYIPQGSFYLGDGNTANAFTNGSSASPFFVNSSTPPTMGTSLGELNDRRTPGVGENGFIDPAFPIGFDAFYIMKYEISQGGYRDFLNTLPSFLTAYATHTILPNPTTADNQALNAGSPNYRNFLVSTGSQTDPIACNANAGNGYNSVDDGEWVACGFLNWVDIAAYLDWSALRPMTETEYEKAARGSSFPVLNEFATGVTLAPTSADRNFNNFNTAAETMSMAPGKSGILTTHTVQFGNAGPMRNGMAASATSNRITSGASYYGVCELTGNLYEPVISVNRIAGRSFKGTLGDGEITSDKSEANVFSWPGCGNNDFNQPNLGGVIPLNTQAPGITDKGGAFNVPAQAVSILSTTNSAQFFNRFAAGGGRGVRQQ
jgi:formylglycine-generating enzyme required for sulfatase activity